MIGSRVVTVVILCRDAQRSGSGAGDVLVGPAPERVTQCLPCPTPTANNAEAFFFDLWENLSTYLRLCVVRTDSCFYAAALLHKWEKSNVKFLIVVRLTQLVKTCSATKPSGYPLASAAPGWPNSIIGRGACPPACASWRSATGSKTKPTAPAVNCSSTMPVTFTKC